MNIQRMLRRACSICVITLMAATLSNCAVLALGGAAAGGYAVAKDERTVQEIANDGYITAGVKTKFLRDNALKAFDFNVDTYKGVVTLYGNAGSPKTVERALLVASSVQGVQQVIDKVVIVPMDPQAEQNTRSIGEMTRDASITASVKTQLFRDGALSGFDFNVDTFKGIVTLYGALADEGQQTRAIQLTKSVKGVVQVIDKTVILPQAGNLQ